MRAPTFPTTYRTPARVQRGIVAIEFAFIFPAFFVIFYAIVSYGLIFAAQQSLTLAAAEGARAALRYPVNPTSEADSITKRMATACAVTRQHLTPFRGNLGTGNCGTAGAAHGVYVANAACPYAVSSAAQCLTVTVLYDYAAFRLVPNLPGNLLPTPPRLLATAVIQINPEYAL